MFSKACEYALRATIYIAQQSAQGQRLSVDEVADNIDAPRSFTAKILQQLNKGNIISSVKGPNGGFYMAEDQVALPVWDVLVTMNEDERLIKCVIGLNECSDRKPCPMHDRYKFIKQQLTELFKEKAIKDLAKETGKKKVFIRNI